MNYDTYKAEHMAMFGCNPRKVWHDAYADGAAEEQERIIDLLRMACKTREQTMFMDAAIEVILTSGGTK